MKFKTMANESQGVAASEVAPLSFARTDAFNELELVALWLKNSDHNVHHMRTGIKIVAHDKITIHVVSS